MAYGKILNHNMMNDVSTSLHLISLNVRGIRDIAKRRKIFAWLRAQKADIVYKKHIGQKNWKTKLY